MGRSRCRRFCPASPGGGHRPNRQQARLNMDFNVIHQPSLLKQRLAEADTPGIANPDQLGSHSHQHLGNYSVVTQ